MKTSSRLTGVKKSILLLPLVGAAPALAFAGQLPLVPQPASVEAPAGPPLRVAQLSFTAPPELSSRVESLARSEWGLSQVKLQPAAKEANLRLEIVPTAPATGYSLKVSAQGIVLQAANSTGLRQGIQTLRQLAQPSTRAVSFAQCNIQDQPRFAHRGLMLDSARHIQSVAGIKRLLDQMEQLKLNVFHWHLTDNNGWRAEVPSFRRLTKVGGFLSNSPETERNGFYSTAQMREIGDYARARGIEVVPEIDIPGHTSAVIEAYPQFLCPTSERSMPSTWTNNRTPNHVLCIGNEELYPFLTTVFKEVAAATGAKRVHIGGDEVEEGIWSKCPRCKAAMEKAGVTKEYEMERVFLSRVSTNLQKEGLQTMNWLERPASGIPTVNATIAWRGGGTGTGQVEKAIEAGVPVLNAKGDYAYLDYPAFGGTAKSGWMPNLSLDQVYNFKVVPDVVKNTRPDLLLGGASTLWTEEVLERDIDGMLYPRLFAFAEQMWTPDSQRDNLAFKERLALLQPQWEARGVRFGAPVVRDRITQWPGATITSTLGHTAAKFPEYALDGNDVTSYLSDKPAKAGDALTITFPPFTAARKLTVLTGSYYLWDEPNGRLKAGVLESTGDGSNWTQLATFEKGFAHATVPVGTRGLRMRLTADQDARLSVADFHLQ